MHGLSDSNVRRYTISVLSTASAARVSPNRPLLGYVHACRWTIGQSLLNCVLCFGYGFLHLSGLSFADCGFVEPLPLICECHDSHLPTVRALRCKDEPV